MITLFSCPKAFDGPVGVTQRNGIRSWVRINPQAEILLLGDEEGIAEAAREFGVRHIPFLKRNEFGTPLVSSIFEEAEKAATHEVMCYLNADILLLDDFMLAVKAVHRVMPRSLLVGRRWNLDVSGPIEFDEGWERVLRKQVAQGGKLVPHFFIDYFVFPRGTLGEIPPFAIGRPAWDNWIIYRARSLHLPVIDLTRAVTVVHQNHDYSHHPEGWKGAMKGEEAKGNIRLAGEVAHVHSLLDADYHLTARGLKRKNPPYFVPFYLYRTLVILSASHPFLKPVIRLIKKLGTLVSSPSSKSSSSG
jgi:hypothetical protein